MDGGSRPSGDIRNVRASTAGNRVEQSSGSTTQSFTSARREGTVSSSRLTLLEEKHDDTCLGSLNFQFTKDAQTTTDHKGEIRLLGNQMRCWLKNHVNHGRQKKQRHHMGAFAHEVMQLFSWQPVSSCDVQPACQYLRPRVLANRVLVYGCR